MRKVPKNKRRTAIYKLATHSGHTDRGVLHFGCVRCSREAWDFTISIQLQGAVEHITVPISFTGEE